MDSIKNPFAAPRPFSKPGFISKNHLAPAPVDFEGLRAIGNEVSATMVQARIDNSAFIRGRSATSVSPDTSVPGSSRCPAPSSDQTAAPDSKRPRKAKRNRSQPPYTGPVFVQSSDGPYIVFDRNHDDGEDIDIQVFKVMRAVRSDAEDTYIGKGEFKGVVLKNEPAMKDQNKAPKDKVTKECSFYYKLNQEQASQSIDWRRKLGRWLADTLGKDGGKLLP